MNTIQWKQRKSFRKGVNMMIKDIVGMGMDANTNILHKYVKNSSRMENVKQDAGANLGTQEFVSIGNIVLKDADVRKCVNIYIKISKIKL